VIRRESVKCRVYIDQVFVCGSVCVCVCVTGGWLQKFAQNECNILFTLIIALRQEGRTGRGHVYTLFEMSYVFKVLSRKREGKDSFGKPRRR
jgi:hypothetical protein